MRLTPAEAITRLAGREFDELLAESEFSVEVYKPYGVDRQSPHTRDEAYVVISGSGTFLSGDERLHFAPGDLLFVPAGVEHRFVDFTADFATWVFFFGREKAPGSESV